MLYRGSLWHQNKDVVIPTSSRLRNSDVFKTSTSFPVWQLLLVNILWMKITSNKCSLEIYFCKINPLSEPALDNLSLIVQKLFYIFYKQQKKRMPQAVQQTIQSFIECFACNICASGLVCTHMDTRKNRTTNLKHSNIYLNSQLYINITIVVERGLQCVSFSNVYIYSTEF